MQMSCCSPPPFQKRQAQQQTKHQFVFDILLYCENFNCETNSELQDINSAFRLSFLYFEFTSRNSSFPPQKRKEIYCNLLSPNPSLAILILSHDSDFICKKIHNCEIKSRNYLFIYLFFFFIPWWKQASRQCSFSHCRHSLKLLLLCLKH